MADLTTLAKVKTYLGPGENVATDAVIETLISGVSEWFEGQVGHPIASAASTATLDGNDKAKILLPSFPVASVASVTVDGVTVPPRATVTGDGWVLSDASIGRLTLVGSVFSKGVQNVVVVYSAGATEVPKDVEMAVNELVAIKYRERTHIGTSSQSLGGASVSFLPALIPEWVRSVIAKYARRAVA